MRIVRHLLSSILLLPLLLTSSLLLLGGGARAQTLDGDDFVSLVIQSFEVFNDVLPYCDTSSNAINSFLFATGRGLQASADQYCIDVAGGGAERRCYYLLIPTCAVTSGTSVPLVMDIHALTACPLFSSFYTEWLEIALDECFIVVWPIGNQDDTTIDCWHVPGGADIGTGTSTPDCCCTLLGDDPPNDDINDDLIFLEMVIDDANEQVITESDGDTNINLQKVIVTGHSNGGIAAMSFGAAYSDRVSCIASFSGTYVTEFGSDYSAVPLWMVHGTNDNVLDYNGINPIIASSPNVATIWSKQNSCTTNTETTIPAGNDDPGDIIISLYESCDNDASVRFVTINNGGHLLYPRFTVIDGIFPGGTSTYPTTQDAWSFCKDFTSDYVPPPKEEEKPDYPCPKEERCTVRDFFGNIYEGTPLYLEYTTLFGSNRCFNDCEISDTLAIWREENTNYKCGKCP